MSSRPTTPLTAAETPIHGGDLDAMRARYPNAPEPWIDLSTGINPNPYPFDDVPKDVFSRLPFESELAALKQAAARRYGVSDVSQIVAAPGTQALIQIIPRLRKSCRVAVLGPTYAEHAASWRREGHDVHEVADAGLAEGYDVFVVVNPNNPTGRIIAREDLYSIGATLAARGGALIADEAFADLVQEQVSVVCDLPPSAIVLRSFGKTYGLAGIRLGFGIASRDIASLLSEHLGPWAVPGPALSICRQALADDAWLQKTRARLEGDAARLDRFLIDSGFRILGGTTLFRLVGCDDASARADALARAGIHVRRFADQPKWLRFGLPPAWAWDRLQQALANLA